MSFESAPGAEGKRTPSERATMAPPMMISSSGQKSKIVKRSQPAVYASSDPPMMVRIAPNSRRAGSARLITPMTTTTAGQ